MADISQARANLLVEETQYRSALSEALWQKTGGAINFINNEISEMRSMKLNGVYSGSIGSTGIDGIIVFRSNVEIMSLSASSVLSGASGSTTIDIHYITDGAGTDGGSIFSTRPAFDSTSPNNANILYNVLTDTDETIGGAATGVTLPIFSKTTFLKGESLSFHVDDAMIGAANFSMYIYFRPIN